MHSVFFIHCYGVSGNMTLWNHCSILQILLFKKYRILKSEFTLAPLKIVFIFAIFALALLFIKFKIGLEFLSDIYYTLHSVG